MTVSRSPSLGDGNLSKSNPAGASRGGDPGDPGNWAGPPSRLHTPVVPSRIDPPVETRHQVLPFDCLAWENFERFCLRLAVGRGEVVHSADHGGDVPADGRRSARDALDARLYGVRGQDQQGIDLYVRLAEIPDGSPERRYLCLQSRHIAKLTAAKTKASCPRIRTVRACWSSSSGPASARASRLATASSAPTCRLACAAARARSDRGPSSPVSLTARCRYAAAAAIPPRACARPADRASSAATSSSGSGAAAAVCHARRSGS
jgi:hypothetical protein